MNYFLKLLSALIGGKFIFTKKSFTRENLVKDFFVKINFQPIESTEFITGHVMGTWRRNCTILLPKTGGRAGPIWSCPKKPPHLSF